MLALSTMLPCLGAQPATGDADQVMTEEEFLDVVLLHHPLAVRADLQLERARATLQMARGGFDPKAYTSLDQKYFKGTRYYSLLEGGVKIPTWFGLELKAGYEQYQGAFLNPERTVPDGGLYLAGLTMPLSRGLLFDQRRAALQQARILQQTNEFERQVLLNYLLYDAGKAYWEWARAVAEVDVQQEVLTAARTRADAVRQGALLGDRPAIDTLEAGIQVQNRELALQSALLERANSEARLNTFLWVDGAVPLEVEPQTRPQSLTRIGIALMAPPVLPPTVPQLERGRLEIDYLEVDERLQREMLKPRLDVEYVPLRAGGDAGAGETFATNNYKWGLQFDMPLFLRKERGKLKLAQLKISEAQLKLLDKTADLEARLIGATNAVEATAVQFAQAGVIVSNYADLLAGERELFRAGESSLFLVNSREQSYIQARLKQLELATKHRKAHLDIRYTLGTLPVD